MVLGAVLCAAGAARAASTGPSVGTVAGAAVGRAVQVVREAGIANVDQLVSQALLNPALMRTLMARATPANTPSLMASLAAQLRPLSLASAVRSAGQQQDRPSQRYGAPFATRRGATRRNDLLPTAPPAASISSPNKLLNSQ